MNSHGPIHTDIQRGFERRIAATIARANVYYRMHRHARAKAYYRRAANLITPSVLDTSDGAFLSPTVLDLAYYFAVTRDRVRARAMWKRFIAWSDYSSRVYEWPSAWQAANALGTGHARHAFAIMLDRDTSVIENVSPFQRKAGEQWVIERALDAGKHGRYKAAVRGLLRATSCGYDPALAYPYYALGVAYWALHERPRAIAAWLAATRQIDDGPPPVDMPALGTAAVPASIMLLRLY